MANEKKIEDKIKAYIISLGGLSYKIHGGDLYQENGIPDLLCCVNGKFIGIEVKDPTGSPSTMQLIQGARILKAKGYFVIAMSVEDVENYLIQNNIIQNNKEE